MDNNGMQVPMIRQAFARWREYTKRAMTSGDGFMDWPIWRDAFMAGIIR